MANEKARNIGGLFTNTKTRMILLLTIVLVLILVIWGFFIVRKSLTGPEAGAAVATVPGGIQSIPGSFDPTAQYVKLQEKENVQKAQAALRTGTSALPTLIKSERVTDGKTVEGEGTGFQALALLQREGGRPKQLAVEAVQQAKCDPQSLKAAMDLGSTPEELIKAGCSLQQLIDAGFSIGNLKTAANACDLKTAGVSDKKLADEGFSACELKAVGASDDVVRLAELAQAKLPGGFTEEQLRNANCDPNVLRKARVSGISAAKLKQVTGCSAAALKAAGYTAKQLKDAGYTAAELRAAGFTARELRDAGFSAKELKDAGFSAKELKDAGFSAAELKAAGFSAAELRAAGFSAAELAAAGFTADELRAAGFSNAELAAAGLVPPTGLPTLSDEQAQRDRTAQLLIQAQAKQLSDRQASQKLKQIQAAMSSQATQLLNQWGTSPNQVYVVGTAEAEAEAKAAKAAAAAAKGGTAEKAVGPNGVPPGTAPDINASDVMFAVLDTAVNSDEPGPVLATIVEGKFKGARLIGSLTPSQQGKKVLLSFNTMVIKGRPSISVSAFAIDPETARLALSSKTNNHYITRYGALFASSFLTGLSSAISESGASISQNADGSFTANSLSLSTGEKAIVAFGEVGKKWGEAVSKNVDRPPTVLVYSGIGLGILFLSDVYITTA